MTDISVVPVGYAVGAEVTGIDLADPIDRSTLDSILRVWHKHLVVIFPDQHINPQQLIAFSQNFGTLDRQDSQPYNRHPDHDEILLITNKSVRGRPSETRNAGQNWHSDMSYTLRPAKGTTLYCIEKPSVGGDTQFANMYLAYETLSEKLRNFLDTLEGIHDVSLIEGMDKRDPVLTAEFRRLNPLVIHPAVRVHPDTGRKALYVNERVRQFVGMSEAESKPLVKFLCERSTSPRFVYRHRWRVNDVVMWDNRCLTHLAVGDYDPSESRHMLRTTCFGDHVGRLANPGAPAPNKADATSRDLAVALGNLHD